MGNLPGSRNTTYGADSPVKSADLNDIQDCLIGGKHGDKVLHINPAWGRGTADTIDSGGVVTMQNAGSAWSVSLPLLVGDRVKSVTVRMFGDGAQDTTLRLKKYTDGVGADLETLAINNTPAAWTDFTMNVDPDEALAVTDLMNLFWDATSGGGAPGLKIGLIKVTYDRP